MAKKVLIFTKRVLPLSNTFVAAQGNNLPSFTPVYMGLRYSQSGIDLINDNATCVQQQYERLPRLSTFLLDGFSYVSPSWKKALGDVSASVIHAHFGKGGYYCTPIAKQLDLPLVTTFHGSDITQKDKFSYNQKHRKTVFEQSSTIIAVSSFIHQKLIQAGCPTQKLVQHYIGIDTDYFSCIQPKSEFPTVLFVGRLIEQKGCQYLLQAFAQIQKKVPEARLLIAGDGVYKNKLQAMASALKQVSFLGAQSKSQVKTLMADAWVTCLPSIKMARGNEEAMAMVSLESQAMGTPVVAFNTGGVSEGLEHGVSGFLCEEKNVANMADNLLTLLSDARLRAEFSEAGVNRMRTLFNIKTQCQRLEKIYQQLC